MATIDIYDKGQVDALLAGKADAADLPSAAELVPDYSGASADDVLTIENGAPVWKAGGSSGGQIITETFNSVSDMITWMASNLSVGDRIVYMKYATADVQKYLEIFDGLIYNIESGFIYSSGISYYHLSSADSSNKYGLPVIAFSTSYGIIQIYLTKVTNSMLYKDTTSPTNIPNGTIGSTGTCTLKIQKA